MRNLRSTEMPYPSPKTQKAGVKPSIPEPSNEGFAKDLTQTLAAGGAQDFVQYQRIVGEISGLNFTEQEITALHGRMEDVEDD